MTVAHGQITSSPCVGACRAATVRQSCDLGKQNNHKEQLPRGFSEIQPSHCPAYAHSSLPSLAWVARTGSDLLVCPLNFVLQTVMLGSALRAPLTSELLISHRSFLSFGQQ